MNLLEHLLKVFFISTLFCSCSSSENELHLYCWANFVKPSLIEKFEAEHNCSVIVNTFDSNEAMYAKLHLGPMGYDIIFPSNYFADLLQKQDLLLPIDFSKVTNIKHVDPKYVNMLERNVANYAIPYAITYTAIGYRKDRIEFEDPSWAIFSKASLKGRLTMLNDPREAIGAALKFLGYSLNTTNESEIMEAEKVVIGWKKNLAKFESEQYKSGIASAEYLAVQGYTAELLLVQRENDNVGCILPKEGSSYAIDLITLSKATKNQELAYAFIDFLLNPIVAAENISYTQLLIANTSAYALLPEKERNNPALFPAGPAAEKSELIQNLGKDTEIYNRAWDRIKAAE